MRFATVTALFCLFLSGCRDSSEENNQAREMAVDSKSSRHALILTPLIDPVKLDDLQGKRAATPRLRKVCYWLVMAERESCDLEAIIDEAHALTGPHGADRLKAQKDSLIRNVTILSRLGCLDAAGMEDLRRGKAPTITKGPYAGEIVTGDHIIPRSVTPELDNSLFNLEMMPLTLNQRKSDKVGQRQVDLARRWHSEGLLSDEGLQAVLRENDSP